MPWIQEWTDNELFVEHNGVRVYHTYAENEESDGYRSSTFCWSPDNDEYGDSMGDHTFDVTELPLYGELVDSERPPYIHIHNSEVPPGYERDSPELRARWESFHTHDDDLIRDLIRKSLDNGDLVPPADLAIEAPASAPDAVTAIDATTLLKEALQIKAQEFADDSEMDLSDLLTDFAAWREKAKAFLAA